VLSYVYFGTNDLERAIAFYEAALAPPGLRLNYSPDFYAAYIRDPDGNKVAAVCRNP
jgi:catechol 2,3-dioxygenase-like lactoylglutathione lyase family enzyme